MSAYGVFRELGCVYRPLWERADAEWDDVCGDPVRIAGQTFGTSAVAAASKEVVRKATEQAAGGT